jgi:hypothetical protein
MHYETDDDRTTGLRTAAPRQFVISMHQFVHIAICQLRVASLEGAGYKLLMLMGKEVVLSRRGNKVADRLRP